jgi:hypothetical protein
LASPRHKRDEKMNKIFYKVFSDDNDVYPEIKKNISSFFDEKKS